MRTYRVIEPCEVTIYTLDLDNEKEEPIRRGEKILRAEIGDTFTGEPLSKDEDNQCVGLECGEYDGYIAEFDQTFVEKLKFTEDPRCKEVITSHLTQDPGEGSWRFSTLEEVISLHGAWIVKIEIKKISQKNLGSFAKLYWLGAAGWHLLYETDHKHMIAPNYVPTAGIGCSIKQFQKDKNHLLVIANKMYKQIKGDK